MVGGNHKSYPAVSEGLWSELLGWAEDLNFADRRVAPVMLANNYRGVFHRLETGLDVPGVRVVRVKPGVEIDRGLVRGAGASSAVIDKVIGVMGSAAEIVSPWWGLLAAAGELGWALLDDWRDVAPEHLSPAQLLIDTAHALAKHEPTVLLVDDVAVAGDVSLWEWLTYAVTHHGRQELLVVFGVNEDLPDLEPRADWPDPLEGRGPLLATIRDLTRSSPPRTNYRWVRPLSRERVTDWVGPCDPALVLDLIAESRGDDEAAAGIWQRWVVSGYVIDQSGKWEVTDEPEPTEFYIADVLDRRLSPEASGHGEMGIIRDGLSLAALSGNTFSGTAVTEVLARQHYPREGFHHLDDWVATVEDWFDDLTPTDDPTQPWLIEPVEWIEAGDPPTWHWKYRFDRDNVVGRLQADITDMSHPTRAETAKKLLDTALDAHGPAAMFDDVHLALAQYSNQDQLAAQFAGRIHATARYRALRHRALGLLYAATAPEPSALLCNELNDTTTELLTAGALDLAVKLGSQATHTADLVGTPTQQAQAHHYYGRALSWAGRRHDDAIEHLEHSLTHRQALYDTDPNPTHQRHLAIALGDLGNADRDRGRHNDAIEHLEHSLTHHQALYDTDPNPTHQRHLAIALGDLETARTGAVEARAK